MKPDRPDAELLRQACERLPRSAEDPRFAARVLAAVAVTPQWAAAPSPPLFSTRLDFVGTLAGLLAGAALLLVVALMLPHYSGSPAHDPDSSIAFTTLQGPVGEFYRAIPDQTDTANGEQ